MVVQESALYRRFLNRWTNTFDIWGRGLRRGPLVASLQPDTETQSTLSSPSITLTDTQDTVATNCLDPSHTLQLKMMMTFSSASQQGANAMFQGSQNGELTELIHWAESVPEQSFTTNIR